MSGCAVRFRLEHVGLLPQPPTIATGCRMSASAPSRAVFPQSPMPLLTGSGDLGVSLLRLMERIDRLAGEQPCSCGGTGRGDSVARRDVYASLCSVLAACGQVGALAVVESYAAGLPAPIP